MWGPGENFYPVLGIPGQALASSPQLAAPYMYRVTVGSRDGLIRGSLHLE